jgi:hypothetical protein
MSNTWLLCVRDRKASKIRRTWFIPYLTHKPTMLFNQPVSIYVATCSTSSQSLNTQHTSLPSLLYYDCKKSDVHKHDTRFLNDGLLYVSTDLVLLRTYNELDNKQIYTEVRSKFLGPVTRQSKTALFLGDTMQIDIQTKTVLQNTGTDRQYYSVIEKNIEIFSYFFSRVSVIILLHILYICWPIYVIFKVAVFGSDLQNDLYFYAHINSAHNKIH